MTAEQADKFEEDNSTILIVTPNGTVFSFIAGDKTTYQSPVVEFYDPPLDADELYVAGQKLESMYGWNLGWKLDGENLDLGRWQLQYFDIQKRRVADCELTGSKISMLQVESPRVVFHTVAIMKNDVEGAVSKRYLINKNHHNVSDVNGVLEVVGEINADVLCKTLLNSGYHVQRDHSADSSTVLEIPFDVVFHPEGRIVDDEGNVVALQSLKSITMRSSADAVEKAVQDLITSYMNIMSHDQTADTASQDVAAELTSANTAAAQQPETSSVDDAHIETLGEMIIDSELPVEIATPAIVSHVEQITTAPMEVTGSIETARSEVHVNTSSAVEIVTQSVVEEIKSDEVHQAPANLGQLLTHGFNGAATARPAKKNKKPQPGAQAQQPQKPKDPASTQFLEAFKRNALGAGYVQKFIQEQRKVFNPNEDGVSHLNASRSGTTELGRFLDINSKTPFVYGDLGYFSSVGALWCYLLGDMENRDSYRNLHGTRARVHASSIQRQMAQNTRKFVEGFHVIIAHATWIKVLSHPQMAKKLKENTLPLQMYHMDENNQGLPQRISITSWYTPVLDEIAKTLRQREETGNLELEPDFGFVLKLVEQQQQQRPAFNSQQPRPQFNNYPPRQNQNKPNKQFHRDRDAMPNARSDGRPLHEGRSVVDDARREQRHNREVAERLK